MIKGLQLAFFFLCGLSWRWKLLIPHAFYNVKIILWCNVTNQLKRKILFSTLLATGEWSIIVDSPNFLYLCSITKVNTRDISICVFLSFWRQKISFSLLSFWWLCLSSAKPFLPERFLSLEGCWLMRDFP